MSPLQPNHRNDILSQALNGTGAEANFQAEPAANSDVHILPTAEALSVDLSGEVGAPHPDQLVVARNPINQIRTAAEMDDPARQADNITSLFDHPSTEVTHTQVTAEAPLASTVTEAIHPVTDLPRQQIAHVVAPPSTPSVEQLQALRNNGLTVVSAPQPSAEIVAPTIPSPTTETIGGAGEPLPTRSAEESVAPGLFATSEATAAITEMPIAPTPQTAETASDIHKSSGESNSDNQPTAVTQPSTAAVEVPSKSKAPEPDTKTAASPTSTIFAKGIFEQRRKLKQQAQSPTSSLEKAA